MIQTEVCVLGAGPGGVAAALQLSKLNIPCVLVDRATFPRDKICGDAVSGKVVYTFNRIDKRIFKEFYNQDDLKANNWAIKFVYANGKVLDIKYKKVSVEELKTKRPDGYISKRENFDNYLVSFVRQEKNIDFRENVYITDFEKVENGYILKSKDGNTTIQAKLVIAADGAHSKFARDIGGIQKENKHYAGAVRAYYKNVKGFEPYNHIELHYIKEFTPGYLWIFPLPNGEANVGAGMRTDKLSKTKRNLNKDLVKILHEHPRFKHRFEDAELDGKIKGFGLPMGSKKRKISGEHFMLVGDAASLIDPLTGEGIGNASISGWLAALHAAECLKANDFSDAFMEEYDKKVYKRLWEGAKNQLSIAKNFPVSVAR